MSSHPEPDRHATATLDGADIYARAIAEFPVGVCVISWGDFIFRDVNQAFADMLGYEPHEIIGRPNTDFLHPDHLAWDADIKRRINAGEPLPPRLERTLLHRDGSTIFAEVRPVRVTCDDGTSVVVSMYGTSPRRRPLRPNAISSPSGWRGRGIGWSICIGKR